MNTFARSTTGQANCPCCINLDPPLVQYFKKAFLINTSYYNFLLVSCPPLDAPDNGQVECTMGDKGANHGDSCNLTCNTGYRPQGVETSICQNDGWSSTDFVCSQGVHNCRLNTQGVEKGCIPQKPKRWLPKIGTVMLMLKFWANKILK